MFNPLGKWQVACYNVDTSSEPEVFWDLPREETWLNECCRFTGKLSCLNVCKTGEEQA